MEPVEPQSSTRAGCPVFEYAVVVPSMVPRAPFLNLRVATARSSTSMPEWVAVCM